MPRKPPKKLQAIPPAPTIGPPAASAEVPIRAPDPASAELPSRTSTAETPSPAESLPENPLQQVLSDQLRHAEEFRRYMLPARISTEK